MKKTILLSLLAIALSVQSQTWKADLDNLDNSIWHHVKTTEHNGSKVALCLPDSLYCCEFAVGNLKATKNQLVEIELQNTSCDAFCVVSVNRYGNNLFWQSHKLSSGQEWNGNHFSDTLSYGILKNGELKVYIWNPNRNSFKIKDIEIRLKDIEQPSYTMPHTFPSIPIDGKTIAFTNYAQITYDSESNTLGINDKQGNPICSPLCLATQYVDGADTLSVVSDKWFLTYNRRAFGKSSLTLVNDSRVCRTTLNINTDDWQFGISFDLRTRFRENVTLVRQSLAMPFTSDNFTVYTRSTKIEEGNLQDEYYLEDEGFSWHNDECQVSVYHPAALSSIQLRTTDRTAFMNIDYNMDHPLIHFPLRNDTTDYFIDRSANTYRRGDIIGAAFMFNVGWHTNHIPRLMHVKNGFEAAFIFSEHADWTDLRTQRAVNFGSETISRASDATAGFVKHKIPVTKSVFYNNPENIANSHIASNKFSTPIATLRTDSAFLDFVRQLRDNGFDICLHTPEIHTSTKENMAEALYFMQKEFNSVSWIDHGYNNGSQNNREDMVCDGLVPNSAHRSLELWKKHGIKYLWNPYFEDASPFVKLNFDNNLMQPFPGCGDATPFRQFFALPEDNSITCWATTSTLETESDELWDYYLSDNRLMQLIEYRSTYVAHTYPAWTNPKRGFWTTNENGEIVVKPSFEAALERIANLRDKHLLLPCTVSDYLDHLNKLNNISFAFTPEAKIQLTNKNNEPVIGVSIISATALSFSGDKKHETRVSGNETIYWFDMEANESIIITY